VTERRSILDCTSAAFVSLAREFGVNRADALAGYRAFYRDDAAPPSWALPITPEVTKEQREGGTIKFLLRFGDGRESESVILPQQSTTGRVRQALCVSSQIGCAMGCTFCETAQMGRVRHLRVEEILAQWRCAARTYGVKVDNVVFMGMGEPTDNLPAVLGAAEILADHNGPAVPASRITISTVGRVAGIEEIRIWRERTGLTAVRLAVSLNAADDETRSAIMPINRADDLAALRRAMEAWTNGTRHRVLVEYVLIPGVNDREEDPRRLCAYLRGIPSTLNVIPYNPRRSSPWPAPSEESVTRFVARCAAEGQRVTRRRTLGRSVMAACGQLGSAEIRRHARRAETPRVTSLRVQP